MLKTLMAGAKSSPLALLFNPTFWLAILAWTALTAYYGYDVGAERERLKNVQMTADALDKQSKANDKVLTRERKLRADDNRDFQTFKEKQDDAEKITRQRIADLQRDSVRLRVPIRRQVCAGQADGSGTARPDAGEEGFADLTAGAAEFLVNLTARGDDAIRKHSAVVDAYERLRIACTAPTDSPTPPTGDTP